MVKSADGPRTSQDVSVYLTPSATLRGLGLVCLGVGRMHKHAPSPRRILTCHAAVFVVGGGGQLTWSHKPRQASVTAPALLWLFPGIPHSYGPDRGHWEERWVLFEGSAVGAYEDRGYLSRADPLVPLADPLAALAPLTRILDSCAGHEPGADVEAAAGLHQLIVGAARGRVDACDGGDDALLAALRDRACSPYSVREHARRLGVSLTTLRRSVQRSAGCSPKEYLIRVRVSYAKELLAATSLTVAQVAREVGHDDAAYFSRMFAGRVGMPPGAFRVQERGDRSRTSDLPIS